METHRSPPIQVESFWSPPTLQRPLSLAVKSSRTRLAMTSPSYFSAVGVAIPPQWVFPGDLHLQHGAGKLLPTTSLHLQHVAVQRCFTYPRTS